MDGDQKKVQKEHNESQLAYHFGDFKISRSQQVLVRSEEKIVISTKAYYLLMTFLENHGKILKKDDIINAVWPGQFVTDTALTKQIVRLRKLIGDTDSDNPMIETHRGVGYRFAIDVELHEQKATKPIINTKNSQPMFKYSIIAFLAMVLMFIGLQYIKGDSYNKQDIIVATPTPINLAIIPTGEKRDWLNSSGLDYLSNLLDKNPSINSLSPKPEWYNDQGEKLAIDLTANKNINYAILVSIVELEKQFIATVKLRSNNKILASEQLKSDKIAQLLTKTNNWVTTVLAAHNQIVEIETDQFLTVDDFALESYLQGLFQQAVDANQQKANDYFQSAVNKDEGFLYAWVKLVETHVHLGHFEKSIAIAETVLNKFQSKLQDKHLIKIHYLVAFSQFRLRDENAAQDSLRKSISYINQSENPFIKLAGLKSLNLLAYLQKDWLKAEEYALQRVALAKDYYPVDGYLAGMYLFLSEIVSYQYKFKESKDYTYLAMDYYEQSNNSNGMITALAGLNQLNYSHHKLDEGVLLTQKAAPYLETATDPDKTMFFLIHSSMILNLRGKFDRTQNYIERMQDIATKLNNPLYLVMVDLVKLHKFYVQNKFNQGQNHIKSMLATFENNPSLTIDLSYVFMFDMLLSARSDDAKIAIEKYNNYLKNYPNLEKQFPYDLKRILGHIYVKSDRLIEGVKLLEEAESGNRNLYNISAANYIGFEILEIMLQYPDIDYKQTLARIDSHTEYDYLLYKTKAGLLARENKFFEAALIMNENKQKANQLWDADDQLLLENYQSKSKQ